MIIYQIVHRITGVPLHNEVYRNEPITDNPDYIVTKLMLL